MDDIARDPVADAVVPVEAAVERLRIKGPVEELAVRLQEPEGGERCAEAPILMTGGEDEEGEPGAEPPPDERAEAEAGGADAGVGPAEGAPLPEGAVPVTDPDQLLRVVFGLLLTVREGLTVLRLAQACETSQEAVRGALARLRELLAGAGLPLEVGQHGDGVKLWTTPEVFPYLEKVKGIKKSERLSPAALETLAVIAYRQPVFRAEIEAIRGVKVGPMLRTLLDCKLVKVVGRADVPGRPLQYGTTQQFLERFGLASLADLPSVKEFKGLQGG